MGWLRRSPEQARQRAAGVCREGPLAAYLSVPFPADTASVDDIEFLALDFETTGLDPERDHVVAVGYVPVVGGRIELAHARSVVVAAPVEVGQSATVHGLTDDTVAAGVPLAEAIEEVLAALAGRVLLAHFATLEVGFLRRACAALWNGPCPLLAVDTLALQRRLVSGAFREDPPPGSLRLWTARERYGLPTYRAHEPLIDALSCAELFLAQVAELRGEADLPLKRILA
jgi:DNA polymerase-3 subunit epsilon